VTAPLSASVAFNPACSSKNRVITRCTTCRTGVSNQMRGRLRHTPSTTRRAKATSFAGECHQLVVPAVAAAQTQKAVGKNAALEKRVEFIPNEPWRLRP
jgi:hypothetical protein